MIINLAKSKKTHIRSKRSLRSTIITLLATLMELTFQYLLYNLSRKASFEQSMNTRSLDCHGDNV